MILSSVINHRQTPAKTYGREITPLGPERLTSSAKPIGCCVAGTGAQFPPIVCRAVLLWEYAGQLGCWGAVRQFPIRENFDLKDGTLFSFPVFLLSPSLPCQHHVLWTPGPIQHRVHPWFQLQELSRGLSYGTSVPFFASRDK